MLTAPPAIASSMVIPSGQEPLTSSSMPNGYSHSSMDEDALAELDITPKSEPNPHELIESHPVSESSPEPDAADDSYEAESPASDGEDEDVVMDVHPGRRGLENLIGVAAGIDEVVAKLTAHPPHRPGRAADDIVLGEKAVALQLEVQTL